MDKLSELGIDNWRAIPLTVYESTLSEVKESFLDKITETVSITDKSIKILVGFITFISAIGLYFVKNHAQTGSYVIFGLLSVANIGVTFWNIKGHILIPSGTTPQYVLTSNFNSSEITDIDKQKLFYKNLIEQYWNNTNRMGNINNNRILLYDITLILSILIIVTSSCYLGSIIT